MNRYLLEYELKTHDLTKEEFAKVLGIDKVTLYRKLNGSSDFTRSEIQKAKEKLELSSDQLDSIFFNC